MTKIKHDLNLKKRRNRRIHYRIKATPNRPKLVVTRSNKSIYLQVVDTQGHIIASESDLSLLKNKKIKTKLTKTEKSTQTGLALAQKLKAKKIKKLAIDRGANQYHGRIKVAVEALKESGVEA